MNKAARTNTLDFTVESLHLKVVVVVVVVRWFLVVVVLVVVDVGGLLVR